MANSQSIHEYKAERFVDRPKILDEIRRWANSSDVAIRVLSIAAAPGSGKTWLLKAFHDEWKLRNPFTIWMNLPKLVNQQEKRNPDQMLKIDSLITWVEGIWQNAQIHCSPLAPLDSTPDVPAILDKLVRILCDCNLEYPPLVIVDGYDEITEKAARDVVERRLLEYLIERDCMRMLIAYREHDDFVLQSYTLKRNQQQIFLDARDPLSEDFARKQFEKLVQERYPQAKGLSIDAWMTNLHHYRWNHPFANAFLFDLTLSRDQSQLTPLSHEDLRKCCLHIITRPVDGQGARYPLKDQEFSWLMRIANELHDEWTNEQLSQTCNLMFNDLNTLSVNGLIVETPPTHSRRKIPDPIRMLLRDFHQMKKGSHP